jgi:hypothetical protein
MIGFYFLPHGQNGSSPAISGIEIKGMLVIVVFKNAPKID